MITNEEVLKNLKELETHIWDRIINNIDVSNVKELSVNGRTSLEEISYYFRPQFEELLIIRLKESQLKDK